MLHPEYPIKTARLRLRPFVAEDINDLFAYGRLAEVARYLRWEPRDHEETREALERKMKQGILTEEGSALVLAVELPEAERVIGEVNLEWLSREHRQGEIGFVFHPEFHGQGYAIEATREMLRLGFAELGLHRIVGRCDPRNTGSGKLMERLRMRQEAHFRQGEMFKGEWGDLLVYAMLESEYQRSTS